jgi:hypothetical protein
MATTFQQIFSTAFCKKYQPTTSLYLNGSNIQLREITKYPLVGKLLQNFTLLCRYFANFPEPRRAVGQFFFAPIGAEFSARGWLWQ